MTAIVIGSNGQLGQELSNLLQEQKVTYISFNHTELDITNEEAVRKTIEKVKPTVIYHCAAYTAVDKAEDEGKKQNWLVNVEGTRNVAKAAKKVGAIMIYISTDYIFDGTATKEYTSMDIPNPQNEYGKAKLAGEEAVKEETSCYYIIRTSWVFGKHGNNFVYTMKRLAKSYSQLTVVSDQYGRPTWTHTLANFMTHLINVQAEYGIYNLANEESCSWYEFAKEILKDNNVEILPVESAKYPQKAVRPKCSIIDLSKAKNTGFKIPTWKEALYKFNESIK